MIVEPLETREAVLRAVLEHLSECLPKTWRVARAGGAAGVDESMVISPPSGASARFALSCAVTLGTENATRTAIAQAESAAAKSGTLPMVVTRFLDANQRAQLMEGAINYADATGNVRIAAGDPPVFIQTNGEIVNPWRGSGRPKGRLSGPARAKLIRALVDFTPPFSIPELMVLADASGGNAAYSLTDYLHEAGLVTQERQDKPRGKITTVDWRELLAAWSQDYGFLASNVVATYLQPRGVARVLQDLRQVEGVRYTVTGSVAAARVAEYAEARAVMIYCDDPADLAKRLRLRPSKAGANVLLAATKYETVYQRCAVDAGIKYAAVSQVAVDLLNGPGRSREEAEFLMDWMEGNLDHWQFRGHDQDARGAS